MTASLPPQPHGLWLGHDHGASPGELLAAAPAIAGGERDCRCTCRAALRLHGGSVHQRE
jgi:hypothetical protein